MPTASADVASLESKVALGALAGEAVPGERIRLLPMVRRAFEIVAVVGQRHHAIGHVDPQPRRAPLVLLPLLTIVVVAAAIFLADIGDKLLEDRRIGRADAPLDQRLAAGLAVVERRDSERAQALDTIGFGAGLLRAGCRL